MLLDDLDLADPDAGLEPHPPAVVSLRDMPAREIRDPDQTFLGPRAAPPPGR